MHRKLTEHGRRDAEAAERSMARAPEATMRRRDFLSRSAYAAGLAAAASLPLNRLLAEVAGKEALAAGLPSPQNMPIDHFVVLMMENRSFDHYFGWLPNADAVQNRTYPDPDNGNVPVQTRHASTLGQAQWQGCGHPDPDHSWNGGRRQLGSSLTNTRTEPDGFLEGDNDEFALCYYNEGDLGFIHPAGKAFTVFDRFHCSVMTSTWPNRYYMWSAQSGGRKDNTPPLETLGNQWPTLFDQALKNNPTNAPGLGLTARYYNSDLPFSAVWGPRGVSWTRPVAEYYADCAAGTLPNITFVDPPFRDGGGGDGISADEHPLGDVRLGQAFMSDIVHAFMESPNWERGALFIVYDEWGGFFDHVRPPSVPDARQSTTNIDRDFGLMGFRIPAVVVSPFANRGSVNHLLCGFESIIKLITYRFGLGGLTTRDDQANNIGLSMNWSSPNFERPDLPDPNRIVSSPCTFGGGDVLDGQQTHASDLAALEDLAARFGFQTGTGAASEIFRQPDSLQKALQ
jgi:phospholipase C